MTRQEQHDLLIRLDERTRNIWRVAENLEKQQKEQNGALRKAIKAIEKNTTFRVITLKVLVYAIPSLLALFLGWLGIKQWW